MYRTFFLCFAALLLGLSACAQEPSLNDAQTAADVEQYAQSVAQKTAAELQELGRKGPITVAEYAPLLKKMSENLIAAGDKMLKIAKEDTEKATGYQILFQGLRQADQADKLLRFETLKKEAGLTDEDTGNPEKIKPLLLKIESLETDIQKRLKTLFEEIEKEGKFLDILAREKFTQFRQEAQKLSLQFSQEKFEAFKSEARQWAGKKIEGIEIGDVLNDVLVLACSEEAIKVAPELPTKVRNELIAFVKSDECALTVAEKGELLGVFEGEAKRGIGADLELYGKTLDDKDFDWAALRGKVVLVKFTATWCVPCKKQIPGMLEAYKKYHDKGFEIVSVYIWDRGDDPVATIKKIVEDEKLPWHIVSESLTVKAGQPAQNAFYKIQGVPTMLLVGKDGKTIDTDVYGQRLQDKLAELFK